MGDWRPIWPDLCYNYPWLRLRCIPLAVAYVSICLLARFLNEKGDKMRKYLLLLAAAALLAAPKPAVAGWTAVTGTDPILTPDSNGNFRADVGEIFTSPGTLGTSGTFTSYVPDSILDPQILGADLSRYRYDLNGAVTAAAGLNATYGGSYLIYYDSNANGKWDGLGIDYRDSAGTFTLNAAFNPGNGTAALTGTLSQLLGPSDPAFRDMAAGSTVSYTGTYTPVVFGQTGTIQGVLRNNGQVPEPGTLALLGAGLLPLLGLRRRK